MEYFIMTKRQKKQLEKMFECLNINAEQLMGIANIKTLEEKNVELNTRVELCEKALIEANKAIISLNARVTELEAKLQNMQNEEIWGGK